MATGLVLPWFIASFATRPLAQWPSIQLSVLHAGAAALHYSHPGYFGDSLTYAYYNHITPSAYSFVSRIWRILPFFSFLRDKSMIPGPSHDSTRALLALVWMRWVSYGCGAIEALLVDCLCIRVMVLFACVRPPSSRVLG